MPRIVRGLCDGHVYQVFNRGNGRQNVFHKDGYYQALGKINLSQYCSGDPLQYCLKEDIK